MSRYKEMKTEHLIQEMVSLCLEVPPELAQEIGSRDNAISFLSDILHGDEYWDHGGPGDGWAPYHVIHILTLLKTKEALELLLETTRNKLDLLDGWITESIPTLLAAFGESAIERLEEWVLDEKLDLYFRGSIATALNVIAHQHSDKTEEIKTFLSKLLEDTNDPTFAAFLIDELLSFKDPKFLPQVRKALEDERIDTDVINEHIVEWLFNLPEKEKSYFKFMESPLEHFSRENISYLRKISYPEKETPAKKTKVKVGRNDPCPCGSGKKYKKCCMKT
jgi:hypothetical protein